MHNKDTNVLESVNSQIILDAIDSVHFEARDQAPSKKEEAEPKAPPMKRGRKPKAEREQWLKEKEAAQATSN